MSDPRTTPPPELVVSDDPARITRTVVDLCRSPNGARDRQLLFGDHVSVLNRIDGCALIRAAKDGYCGWVDETSLGAPMEPTHRVTARGAHIYADANMKSPDIASLSFGSLLCAENETPTFIQIAEGFVPRQHVYRLDAVATDPAAVAELFLGAPYLWGGNSQTGIDCSGLVQAACLACGIECPGDSDQQAAQLGTELPAGDTLRRNDVVFWKGHVALVFSDDMLIHANAGHMAVVLEPLQDALERIQAQGDGAPTGYRRLPLGG